MDRKLIAVIAALGLSLTASLTLRAQSSSQDQSSSQQSDSVAAAARKAREHKKESPKPKKIYTDDDIKPAQRLPTAQQPGAETNPAPSQPAQPAAQGDQTAQGSAASAGKNDEVAWRKRFAAQREKIARAEKELDVLQREVNKAQLQYYSDPQKALTEQYTRQDINDKDAKIVAKQKEIDDLKQQLSDMEDDLRKSGGDSGWARP